MNASPGPYFVDGNKIVSPKGYNIATVNSHATTEGAATAILLASSFEMLQAALPIIKAIAHCKGEPEDWSVTVPISEIRALEKAVKIATNYKVL